MTGTRLGRAGAVGGGSGKRLPEVCPSGWPTRGGLLWHGLRNTAARADRSWNRSSTTRRCRTSTFRVTELGTGAISWVGPVLMLAGTEDQKREHLPPIARAERYWCTLYSEPGSGSDLASLQTSAVRDGDDYVINGQKIWDVERAFRRLGMAGRTHGTLTRPSTGA